MRVCHIVSGDLWAGAEIMAAGLLEGLHRAQEVELEAILLNEGRLERTVRGCGIPTAVLDEGGLSFPGLASQTRARILRDPPDLVHSHRYKENLLAWIATRGLPGTRLVATQHGMPEMHTTGSSIRQRFLSTANFCLLSSRFDRTVAVSGEIRDAFLTRHRFHPERVRVVHNGIVLPVLRAREPAHRPIVIGSAGRFFPVKDYPLMVDVARELLREYPDARFELAGDGPDRGKIESRVRRYGLEDRFALCGFQEEMSGFYRNLDLYLCTSIHEGIPMSVLEAMAHGIPVVAPDVGGFREIVRDGIEGFLVRARTSEGFGRKCLELIRDRAWLEAMGKAARERVADGFTVDRMTRNYLDIYRDLLS